MKVVTESSSQSEISTPGAFAGTPEFVSLGARFRGTLQLGVPNAFVNI
jgi:hypothetical protein